MFKEAAESYTIPEFNSCLARIEATCPKLSEYLVSAGFEKWARAHANCNRYNMMTSNNAESLSSIFKGKKDYPIVALLEFARGKLTSWFQERREKALENQDRITPEILKVIRKSQEEVGLYRVERMNASQFEIKGEGAVAIVDLSAKTCTCRIFDVEKVPCVHALSAITHIKANVSDFVASFYTNDAWRMAYAKTIYPVLEEDEENVPDVIKSIKCYPPVVRKRAGRPPCKRKISIGEFKRRIKHSK